MHQRGLIGQPFETPGHQQAQKILHERQHTLLQHSRLVLHLETQRSERQTEPRVMTVMRECIFRRLDQSGKTDGHPYAPWGLAQPPATQSALKPCQPVTPTALFPPSDRWCCHCAFCSSSSTPESRGCRCRSRLPLWPASRRPVRSATTPRPGSRWSCHRAG